MKDALRIPVLEDDDSDVEFVRRRLREEIPVVVQDERRKALFGVVIEVSEPRRAEASLEGQVPVVLRETCSSREGCRIYPLERPGAGRAADRNYSGQTVRSTNYVKFRSQNTQACAWRLDLEKSKRTLMYARGLLSSHRPRTEWREKSFLAEFVAMNSRFAPERTGQCALGPSQDA